jgi:hypothetical protein
MSGLELFRDSHGAATESAGKAVATKKSLRVLIESESPTSTTSNCCRDDRRVRVAKRNGRAGALPHSFFSEIDAVLVLTVRGQHGAGFERA